MKPGRRERQSNPPPLCQRAYFFQERECNLVCENVSVTRRYYFREFTVFRNVKVNWNSIESHSNTQINIDTSPKRPGKEQPLRNRKSFSIKKPCTKFPIGRQEGKGRCRKSHLTLKANLRLNGYGWIWAYRNIMIRSYFTTQTHFYFAQSPARSDQMHI